MLGLIKIISYLISIFMNALVIFIIGNSAAYAQEPGNNLKITYIANEGFLPSSSAKNILIDALFPDGYGLFADFSQETINSIMNDKPPFNNVNLYFLTHYHKDHCDPSLLNDYLAKHKNVRLITNKPSFVLIHGNIISSIFLKNNLMK